MGTFKLKAPLSEEDALKLSAGDVLYITGPVFTLRDQGHKKALEERVELGSNVLYHCGPIVREKGKKGGQAEKGQWELVSAGPTTSARMNAREPEFIERYGIRAVIGKGGMSKEIVEAMKGRAVYLAFTGGCGALAAEKLDVKGVQWLELGMVEALWKLEAKEFGPLVVAVDAEGNSLYK